MATGVVSIAAQLTGLRAVAVALLALNVPLYAALWAVTLRYDFQVWGAVFPLGMYAACSARVARAIDAPMLDAVARGFVFVALGAWAAAALGAVASLVRPARLDAAAPRRRGHRWDGSIRRSTPPARASWSATPPTWRATRPRSANTSDSWIAREAIASSAGARARSPRRYLGQSLCSPVARPLAPIPKIAV